jgi:predicted aminopeptidase
MINSTESGSALSSTPRAPAAQTSANTRSATACESTRTGHRKSALFILILFALQSACGCYYTHLAQGQTRVLWGRLNISDVLADRDTPPLLAERLTTVLQTRDFARQIGLEVDGQYTSYLPWPGDRIVTSLIVTRPGEFEAVPFRFPLIGAVPYKGFFDIAMAEAEADKFRNRGMDVCLVPVNAYSTLGFFDDPVSDPMLAAREGRLIETILHELVHSTVFLKSRPNFNEAAASFIGQEASVRFFAADPPKAERRRQEVEDARSLARFLLEYREEVRTLYAGATGVQEALRLRQDAENRARDRLRTLPLTHYQNEKLADYYAE